MIFTVSFLLAKTPHEYEPLPEDVKKTSQADLIFYNGINLETGGNAWFTKLVENAKKTENKITLQSAKALMLSTLKAKTKRQRRPTRLAQP